MHAPAALPPDRCQLAIVGGGIVGLAVARELLRRRPESAICVLEREQWLGSHQTGHNSGVIHAGIYYAPGSLKARLCVEGARELYRYCGERDIAHRRCGKTVLATDASQLGRLEELERRARANGVDGIRRLDRRGIEALEPHARGIAGIHSPDTGIVDFGAVAQAFADDVAGAGGMVATGCEVRDVTVGSRSILLTHSRGATEATHALFCAGAWADRLAVSAGADPDPRIVPFRGAYLRLVPPRDELVRGLIYPVPDPSLPFLGIHLTRTVHGEVLIGPSALMAGARDARALGALRAADLRDTLAWPGTWRLLARSWRAAATELHRAAIRSVFVEAAARYVPELSVADTLTSFAGVRAQAVTRRGELVDDFVFSRTPRALHVRNAPSPAATSSLAIARHVADEAERAFAM
jgi:L-2-hydroxyglutarate oxidase